MSRHQVRGGDVAGLFARFSQLQAKCQTRTGRPYRLIVIHEAGLDGFWIHRTLQNANIESHVVDPASIATSRRRRRVETDGVDGEALVRALLAHKGGEPRVCAMAKAPTPEQEDRRQISREHRSLTAERVKRRYPRYRARLYRRHAQLMAHEDGEIFPAAEATLTLRSGSVDRPLTKFRRTTVWPCPP